MVLTTLTIDTFLLSSILALVLWLFISRFAFQTEYSAQNMQRRQQVTPRSQSRRLLSIFIALHAVYMMYKLVVQSPQNIFHLLHLPLNESSDGIRLQLMRRASVPALPIPLEALLTRLQSFDARLAYIRFGHSVVQDCEYCTSFNDFALYALPLPVLEYVRMAAVIGLVTIRGSGCERLRFWVLALLSLAAMAESYFVLATEVTFSPGEEQTLMVHDVALRTRRIFFILLPPLLYIIPSRRAPLSPLQSLPDIVARGERTRAHLQLLRLTSAARARHPELSASADAWWAEQRADGQYAANDPALQEMASKLNVASGVHEERDDKGLRERAKTVVEAFRGGLQLRD